MLWDKKCGEWRSIQLIESHVQCTYYSPAIPPTPTEYQNALRVVFVSRKDAAARCCCRTYDKETSPPRAAVCVRTTERANYGTETETPKQRYADPGRCHHAHCSGHAAADAAVFRKRRRQIAINQADRSTRAERGGTGITNRHRLSFLHTICVST